MRRRGSAGFWRLAPGGIPVAWFCPSSRARNTNSCASRPSVTAMPLPRRPSSRKNGRCC
ncbi:hypothetical protein IF1G_07415 [Cordyceps javanica]|uniref:Uncharacterized protein n=1 Tax=Cordyceps javanica TaxID=43265 RepID=A0A545UW39_9HYPO|nr:hypothetical protein IF1G_07415 [Cordyceps javanica]TQW02304.1 hypothetical protein IF2G_10107 [Cordyceps javanica]